jgi:hypothetical protein
MLAGMRSCFLLFFLAAFSVAASLPVHAQVNGVPPSVTSIGFGGHNNLAPGVRPSVTSLGSNGSANNWPVFGSCCANFFWPANLNPPLSSGRHRQRHGKDHADFLVGVSEPVYIPYALPDAQETDQEADDDSPDVDYVHSPGPPRRNAAAKRAGDRDSAPQADAAEFVDAQPPTVLVFKDGHHSDVLNYAIVGDTLFDFSAGRTRKILLADLDLPATHKANDDRGVDFEIPASGTAIE